MWPLSSITEEQEPLPVVGEIANPPSSFPFLEIGGNQPFWGSMIAAAGAELKPIPYKSLAAEKLADAIKQGAYCYAEEFGEAD
ncbi:UDP-glucose-sterol transferase [Penicillium longicatenatum]|nr:UDP-glucose-sterol transferase [Penicillium longicatenatum]